jgi:hypothetical protein
VESISHESFFTQGLAPEAMVGRLNELSDTEGRDGVVPSNFVAGPPFVDLLHRLVSERVPNIPEYQAEASAIGDGWLYVVDRRGRVKTELESPQDVVGAIAIRGGIVQRGSYRRNDGYALLTTDGFSLFHKDLTDALMNTLLSINAQQSQQPNRR